MVNKKLVFIFEKFFLKLESIFLPEFHSRKIKTNGINPPQIIGFQNICPPINIIPKSIIGNNVIIRTKIENRIPIGNPINNADFDPIFSNLSFI